MTRIYYASDSALIGNLSNLVFNSENRFDFLFMAARTFRLVREEAFDIGASYAGTDTTKIPPGNKQRLLNAAFNHRHKFSPSDKAPTIYLFIHQAAENPQDRLFSLGADSITDAVNKFSLATAEVPNLTNLLPRSPDEITVEGGDLFFGPYRILCISSQKFQSYAL